MTERSTVDQYLKDTRLDQAAWRKIADTPLTLAAVVFLIAYSLEVLLQPGAVGTFIAETTIWCTWLVFLVDYVVNLALAPNRWTWFRDHILDLLVVALPVLRPLRLLRLLTVLNAVQRSAGSALRGRVAMYVGGGSALLVFLAALAVLDAERSGADANIVHFGDALWWAIVTITTVGYGDLAPVTEVGRLIAVGLMLGGIALLGVVTATLASWIIEGVAEAEEGNETATRQQIEALNKQIAVMQRSLDALHRSRSS